MQSTVNASQVDSAVATPIVVTVRLSDGRSITCNRFWLRDNCPSNGDRASLFRAFSVASITDDLTIVRADVADGELLVEFSDGTIDRFSAQLLGVIDDADIGVTSFGDRWRSDEAPSEFDFADVLVGGSVHHALLEQVVRSGFALVTAIPDAPSATERMAAWLGPVRETDFGRVFDIVTEPDPFTPSQSEAALDPHTDDPYRYSPAGMSILHCVAPCSGDGGASTIVDGFAVAEALAASDPEGFDVLTRVAVPYVHRRHEAVEQGLDVHLSAEAPVVALDARGRVCGIRFHERSMATMRMTADDAEQFYRAFAQFARLVRSDRFAYHRHLEAGEAIVYDNQRVLHGRTAISDSRTRRHLRLCTVDRDQVHSRVRRLREQYAPGNERLPLAAGSLS